MLEAAGAQAPLAGAARGGSPVPGGGWEEPAAVAGRPGPLARFAAAIRERQHFPRERIEEFRGLRRPELAQALGNTRAVRGFLETRIRPETRRGRDLLEEPLDLALFSCDHRWRDIARGLNRLPRGDAEADACRRLALRAYAGYLRSRERALAALARAG